MKTQKLSYNGKNFVLPLFSTEGGMYYTPQSIEDLVYDTDAQVIQDLNSVWDVGEFKTPRAPVSFGYFPEHKRQHFTQPAVRTLDMPIKFPGTEYRIPQELAQFADAIKWIANVEETINPEHDKYFCYLTVDQSRVKAGTLHREAPCHVDGFQGGRWDAVEVNHSYTLSNAIPTVYYPQPFLVDMLDIEKHDFFWEFNRQVAMTNSHYAIKTQPWELVLMNAYSVHRGDEAECDVDRTWIRLSYEVREFDRLGNAHNPLFEYNWDMVERDIEQLNLVAYDQHCDPSLRVFPWQAHDGTPNPPGVKTKPNLTPFG